MPFKSEAQRRYLWANEPEIARDWTDTYGSRIQKNDGGIMRLGFYMGGASPDEGHENDPGHGANAPSDDHSYKTHHPNIHGGMKTQNVVTPANVFTDVTKDFLNPQKDYFNQTWSGQPNFLGFGGGYRNLKTPNDAGSGYQSRLNPMGLMSLLGGYMKKPFSLAATGINAVRNKFGPAWKDWTDSQYFNEFLNKRKAAQYEDAIARDNLYDPNARIQDTSFKQSDTSSMSLDEAIDEWSSKGIHVYDSFDEFLEETGYYDK